MPVTNLSHEKVPSLRFDLEIVFNLKPSLRSCRDMINDSLCCMKFFWNRRKTFAYDFLQGESIFLWIFKGYILQLEKPSILTLDLNKTRRLYSRVPIQRLVAQNLYRNNVIKLKLLKQTLFLTSLKSIRENYLFVEYN